MTKPVYARVYGLVARRARKAVIFRRGPSNHVLLLSWDLADDTLHEGQWLKGRIYERRSDLSPDGSKLVYFGANQRPPEYSWTAVSSPPWLTARYFFPKGDTWGGGGLFDTDTLLRLNHEMAMKSPSHRLDARGCCLPRYLQDENALGHFANSNGLNFSGLKVIGLGANGGKGEDEPILSLRLKRDGWTFSDRLPEGILNSEGQKQLFRKFPPEVWIKPSTSNAFALCVIRYWPSEKHDAKRVEIAHLLGSDGKVANAFGRIDWADFDHNGDVIFSQIGCLYRLNQSAAQRGEVEQSSLVADLNQLKFEERIAPY